MSHLPTDAAARKNLPMATGLLDYFPKALAEVASLSRIGNEQHNPGQPLHWAREKSTDHADCIMRHLVDRGTVDSQGVRESARIAWRALAMLEVEIETAAEWSTRKHAKQVYETWHAANLKHAPRDGSRVATDAELRAAGLAHLVMEAEAEYPAYSAENLPKVGDRVRVINVEHGDDVDMGQVGTVRESSVNPWIHFDLPTRFLVSIERFNIPQGYADCLSWTWIERIG